VVQVLEDTFGLSPARAEITSRSTTVYTDLASLFARAGVLEGRGEQRVSSPSEYGNFSRYARTTRSRQPARRCDAHDRTHKPSSFCGVASRLTRSSRSVA